jgi:hypothetical protein
MASGRRSYRGLLRLPAFGLYDEHGKLVASVRAVTIEDARDVFRRYATRYGYTGVRVRKL